MPDAATALQRSAAVFEGRVVSVRVEGDRREATLRVTQAWKGVESEEVVVGTMVYESMCGIPFAEGSVWLVYADGTPGGTLDTGLCQRTRLRTDAEEDVRAFGAGVTPVDPDGPSPLDDQEQEEPVEPPGSRGGCASCSTAAPADGALMLLIVVVLRRRAATHRRG